MAAAGKVHVEDVSPKNVHSGEDDFTLDDGGFVAEVNEEARAVPEKPTAAKRVPPAAGPAISTHGAGAATVVPQVRPRGTSQGPRVAKAEAKNNSLFFLPL